GGPCARRPAATHGRPPELVVARHRSPAPQSASPPQARPHTRPPLVFAFAPPPEPSPPPEPPSTLGEEVVTGRSTQRASSPAPSHAPISRTHGEHSPARSPARTHARPRHTAPAGHGTPP